ncbi:hypothetical protein [Sorangium cellulosum]|uniref:hypothetical protein n=1 Tax=Sorangium cellulosum TaxID=56 RepID=UPI000A6547A0|nr:hypothetical protein [Sorangium cellulosum]
MRAGRLEQTHWKITPLEFEQRALARRQASGFSCLGCVDESRGAHVCNAAAAAALRAARRNAAARAETAASEGAASRRQPALSRRRCNRDATAEAPRAGDHRLDDQRSSQSIGASSARPRPRAARRRSRRLSRRDRGVEEAPIELLSAGRDVDARTRRRRRARPALEVRARARDPHRPDVPASAADVLEGIVLMRSTTAPRRASGDRPDALCMLHPTRAAPRPLLVSAIRACSSRSASEHAAEERERARSAIERRSARDVLRNRVVLGGVAEDDARGALRTVAAVRSARRIAATARGWRGRDPVARQLSRARTGSG